MKTSMNPIYRELKSQAIEALKQAGITVHFTTMTSPHILSECGTRFLSLNIDKYSHKSPDVVVMHFYRRCEPISLPKAIQSKWDVYRYHEAMEVKLITTMVEARQIMKLVPSIIQLLEKKQYTQIQEIIPFEIASAPENRQRISTVEADKILRLSAKHCFS